MIIYSNSILLFVFKENGLTILVNNNKRFFILEKSLDILFEVYQQIVDLALSSVHYCACYMLIVLMVSFCDIVLSCAYALNVFLFL